MRFRGFIGPTYTLQSVNVDCQRCVNLYPELNEVGYGKEGEVASFVSTPGLNLKLTLGGGMTRGVYAATDGLLYAVGGNKLYRISSSYVATELGTLNTLSTQCSFADNGTSLCVVDGSYGYVVTLSSGTFAQITDEDFKPADKVAYLDGYFIFNEANTGRFFFSDINSTDFDALDIATAEGAPDDIVSILVDHRDLYLFGSQTTEVWFNSGDADNVFQRIQGAFVEHGCAAPFSVSKINNSVFWLGQDDKGSGIVYAAQGYQPQRISTHAVEYAFSKYDDLSTAVAYSYQENGHDFYVLNFDNAPTSWCFDTRTGMWHERAFTNNGSLERHRANSHAFAYGSHIVGDYDNGKIYELTSLAYTDAGDEITRKRVAPHVSSNMSRAFHHSLQVDMEVGVGLDGATTVQGHNPQAMIKWSDDGGHSWSNELWTSFGKIGARKQRAIWRRLGQSRDRVYDLTITEPVKVAIVGAELDITLGAS